MSSSRSRQQRSSRSSSRQRATRSAPAWSQAWHDRAATSPACRARPLSLVRRNSNFCGRLFPVFAVWRSWPMPTMFGFREHVEAGGLMSYGANFPDQFRRAADYVDKILRGAKPADIPVEQPTRFDLVINLTTAKAIGLAVPETFLVRATEVI